MIQPDMTSFFIVYFRKQTYRCPVSLMNKSQLLLILFLLSFVAALWLLVFSCSMVPAHYRDPFGTQTIPIE